MRCVTQKQQHIVIRLYGMGTPHPMATSTFMSPCQGEGCIHHPHDSEDAPTKKEQHHPYTDEDAPTKKEQGYGRLWFVSHLTTLQPHHVSGWCFHMAM